jgi:methyl acetate hydrolase
MIGRYALKLAVRPPLAAIFVFGCAADAGEVRPESTVASLDRELQVAVARQDAPGLVAIAGDRQGIIYRGAFGLAESARGQPMRADAIFHIASMTKPVTAVAAMQLIEEHRLSLDDDAAKYLPELANPKVLEAFDPATGTYRLRSAASPITVRQLFTHTSGLGYPFTSGWLYSFKPRPGESSPFGPLLFDPGLAWHYGTSTDYLGRIIEAIAGEDLDTYFQRRIFVPLGMVDTGFNVPTEKWGRVVNRHARRSDGGFTERSRQPPAVTPTFNGGGGLYSTADDYMRFLQMLFRGGEFNGAQILSRRSVALMGQNQIGELWVRTTRSVDPQKSQDFTFVDEGHDKWGLGFLISGRSTDARRSAGSLSWGGIFNTYFWVDPARGVAGVILMQFAPFADLGALRAYETFERGVYRMLRP